MLGARAGASNVRGLWSLRTLSKVVVDLLVLLQVAVAGALDRAEVHEDVCAAVVGSDETEPLLGVEPLDGACGHEAFPPFMATSDMTAIRRPSGVDAGEGPAPKLLGDSNCECKTLTAQSRPFWMASTVS